MAGLRARCRQAARRAGYRAARVGDAVCDAILAECDLMAKEGTMNSTEDIYQIVLDEVNAAMG